MIPRHLSGKSAQGLVPGEVIAQFEIGEYRNFVYLILDWGQQTGRRQAAWVDPQSDLDPPLRALREHGFELVAILLTHTHFDHVAGVPKLHQLFPQVPIHVHRDDAHRIRSKVPASALREGVDGDIVRVGDLQVTMVHTPGHSAGELCYRVDSDPPYLLTGDTIFIRDCGRTDLPTGSTEEMFDTLQRVKTFPPELVILPGHHYAPEIASTLGEELRQSPPFQCRSVEELGALP